MSLHFQVRIAQMHTARRSVTQAYFKYVRNVTLASSTVCGLEKAPLEWATRDFDGAAVSRQPKSLFVPGAEKANREADTDLIRSFLSTGRYKVYYRPNRPRFVTSVCHSLKGSLYERVGIIQSADALRRR